MVTRKRNYYYARSRKDKFSSPDELPWIRLGGLATLDLPHPVVLINGAFDLLHSGHLKIIAVAREKAGPDGTVLCAMDSDKKIAASKGEGRPILSWVERATALSYMPIDYLIEIATDDDMARLIALVEPDLRVQGDDYKGKRTRYPGIPKCFVANRGMHTTEIINRCQRILNTQNN